MLQLGFFAFLIFAFFSSAFNKKMPTFLRVMSLFAWIGIFLYFLGLFLGLFKDQLHMIETRFQPVNPTKTQEYQVKQPANLNKEDDTNKDNKIDQKSKEEVEEEIAAKQLKEKMDFLIPIALECKWTESDVRDAVEIMENCGVKFDKLLNMGKKLEDGKGQFSCEIKDTPYNSPPLLRINTKSNHIERIYVELTSNCNVNYFVNNRPSGKEIFRHSYSNRYMLYINKNSQKSSRNAFDEIIFVDDKIDKLRDKIEDYVKSHNGKAIENGKWSVAIQLETDNHNNPVPIPISDFINSKIIYLGEFDYSIKSTTYGKNFDKYHAELLMDGDNVIEITNVETN